MCIGYMQHMRWDRDASSLGSEFGAEPELCGCRSDFEDHCINCCNPTIIPLFLLVKCELKFNLLNEPIFFLPSFVSKKHITRPGVSQMNVGVSKTWETARGQNSVEYYLRFLNPTQHAAMAPTIAIETPPATPICTQLIWEARDVAAP